MHIGSPSSDGQKQEHKTSKVTYDMATDFTILWMFCIHARLGFFFTLEVSYDFHASGALYF